MARDWAGAVRSWYEVNADLDASGARPGRGAARLPDARRRLADRGRAPGGLPREGAARGQAARRTGSSRPRARGARSRRSRVGAARPRAVPLRASTASPRARPSWASAIALAQTLLKLTVPGRARRLPGRRAAGRSRSSTPTTAGRSTGPRGASRWTRCAAARRRRRETAKLHLIAAALDLRRRRPEAFAGDYTPVRRATTCRVPARRRRARGRRRARPRRQRRRLVAAPRRGRALARRGHRRRSSSCPTRATLAGVLGPRGPRAARAAGLDVGGTCSAGGRSGEVACSAVRLRGRCALVAFGEGGGEPFAPLRAPGYYELFGVSGPTFRAGAPCEAPAIHLARIAPAIASWIAQVASPSAVATDRAAIARTRDSTKGFATHPFVSRGAWGPPPRPA